jgi:hypothetical protein
MKYEYRVASNCITAIQNLVKIYPLVLKFNHLDEKTDTFNPIRFHFRHIKQYMNNTDATLNAKPLHH